MKKIVLLIVVLFSIPTAALQAAPRDVLAHSSGEWSWFAHVTKAPNLVAAEAQGSNEQTECFVLQNAPGQQWKSLSILPGRAIGLAARSSQLAVLMANGTWLTVWEDGSAAGQPLPADGQIKTLADDGSHLWAIGSVAGGITAAQAAIGREAAVTQPSTQPFSMDASTAPATQPVELHLVRSIPAKLVLFQEQNGRWAAVDELPPDAVMTPEQEMSMTVIGGSPIVSFKSDSGALRTLQLSSDHRWKDIITPLQNPGIENFKSMSNGFKPLLWATAGNDSGELLTEGSSKPIALGWVSSEHLDGLPAATFGGGYVCVFGPHAGKVLEQRYKEDGTPIETAAELNVLTTNESLLPRWLEVFFLTAMGFSVGASVFRQWSEPARGPAVKPPVAATMLPRLSAGLLDALPVIGALFYLGLRTNALNDMDNVSPLEAAIVLGSAMAIYILHTTIVETLTARSAGKWAFGLKVVQLDGSVPARSQLLIRNLLRVIDPLVMIIISPQRQRSADAVAGTMVVPLEPLPEPPEEFDDQD